jgi:phage/plasmid primase-like uncharacterized protein
MVEVQAAIAEARAFLVAEVGADGSISGGTIIDVTVMLVDAGLEQEEVRSTARDLAFRQGFSGSVVEKFIERGLAEAAQRSSGKNGVKTLPAARADKPSQPAPKPETTKAPAKAAKSQPGPTEGDIIDQFVRELERADIEVPRKLITDGKLRRCDAKGKGGKSDAAFLLYVGTTRAGHLYGVGGFQNWRLSNQWTEWQTDRPEFSEADWAEIAEKRRAAAAANEAEKLERQAQARSKAASDLAGSSALADDHPYLQRKCVRAHRLTADGNAILVPMRDIDGVLHNYQKIGPNGTKRFLFGGRVDGCFHVLGELAPEVPTIIIGEGFATCATIREVTELPVVIAFDSGNLVKVTRALRRRYPDAKIVIAGDDDWKTKKADGTLHNPGRIKATEAAEAVSGVVVMPAFGPAREDKQTDFNDMAAELGNDAVKALFKPALELPPPHPESGDEGDPLAELLAKYSIVLVGSSARIIEWKHRRLFAGQGGEHEVPNLLTAESFRLFHRDKVKFVKGPDGRFTKLQITTQFFEKARRYHDLVFIPGGPREIGDQLNLWRGFGVKATAGKWPLMRAHMREVMAAGIEEQDRYNFRWMAWAVQNPDQQAEVALVFRGLKGTGKGTLGNALCRTFGPHGLQIADKKHLIGSFNMHMSQCAFLFADEAYWPGDKDGEGALKRLITEPTLTIEPKGLDLFIVPNNLHVMIAGNEEWITPASSDERRFAVNEVSAVRKGDLAYFNALYAELNIGGLAAMLHDLLAFDLDGWHPRIGVPQTKGLQKQKALSRRGVDRLVEIIATDGAVPCPHELYSDIAMTSGEGDGKGFYAHAKTLVPDLKFSSSITIGTALIEQWGCQRWKSGTRRGIRFPPLQELREAFVAKHGAHTWPDSNTTWDDPADGRSADFEKDM